MSLVIAGAFGFNGGWSLERRTSRKARARERAALHYTKRQGERERAAKVAAVLLCVCGCGVELRDDPRQRGPRKKWASPRCYFRSYMRARRAAARIARPEATR